MARRSARLSLPALQIAASALLCGCPQLLNDEFQAPTSVSDTGGSGGAAGSDGTGGAAGAGGSAGDDAASDRDAATTASAPRVVASRPSAGQQGVLSDASIELTFSEPMEATSTEAAYASAELAPADVDFSWSADGRVLVIDPHEPLAHASGSDAASVVARAYSLSLSAGAPDTTGRPLEPFALSFLTAREISATLSVVSDSTLTGKYRSDETDGVGECAIAQQTVCAGVGATTGNPTYRAFATFDLGPLPADRLAITSAELSLTVSVLYGTPFVSLGALLLESVRYDAVGLAAFNAPSRGATATLATAGDAGDSLSLDVSAAVRADAAESTRSQFRLRFSADATLDGGPDLLQSNWPTLQLRVGYLIP